jgi:hypothetical protein
MPDTLSLDPGFLSPPDPPPVAPPRSGDLPGQVANLFGIHPSEVDPAHVAFALASGAIAPTEGS